MFNCEEKLARATQNHSTVLQFVCLSVVLMCMATPLHLSALYECGPDPAVCRRSHQRCSACCNKWPRIIALQITNFAGSKGKKERKARGKKKSVVMKTSETERTPEYKCLKIEIKHLQKSASHSSICLKPPSFPGLQVFSFLTVFICSGFSTVLSNI